MKIQEIKQKCHQVLNDYSRINANVTILDLALINCIPSFYTYQHENLFKNEGTEYISESINKLTPSFMGGTFPHINSSHNQKNSIINEMKQNENDSDIEEENKNPLNKTYKQILEIENNLINYLNGNITLSHSKHSGLSHLVKYFGFKFMQTFSKYEIGFEKISLKNNFELNGLINMIKEFENEENYNSSKNWCNNSPANEDVRNKMMSHNSNNDFSHDLLNSLDMMLRNKIYDHEINYNIFDMSFYFLNNLVNIYKYFISKRIWKNQKI